MVLASKPNDLSNSLKHITGYSDADWAGDPLTGKSTSCRDDYLKLKRTWKQESGKREVVMWPFMKTNRELESQRLELHQAHQWTDQAQGERINLCGEMEMRSRLFQESRSRNCQEIGELRRICFKT